MSRASTNHYYELRRRWWRPSPGVSGKLEAHRKLGANRLMKALERAEIREYLDTDAPRLRDAEHLLRNGDLDQVPEAALVKASETIEVVSAEFVRLCREIDLTDALVPALFAYSRDPDPGPVIDYVPSHFHEYVTLLEVDPVAKLWNPEPVPHVVLRVNLARVKDTDAWNVLVALKKQLGLDASGGPKSYRQKRVLAIVRECLGGEAGTDGSAAQHHPAVHRDAWNRFFDTGVVTSLLINDIATEYASRFVSEPSVSDDIIRPLLKEAYAYRNAHDRWPWDTPDRLL